MSYRLTENIAFGPAAIFYGSSKEDRGGMITPAYNGYALGLNGMYYFGSASRSSWYSSAHIYYAEYSSYPHGLREGEVTELDGVLANLAVGYRWRWSRFTMYVGGGAEYRNQTKNSVRLDVSNNRLSLVFQKMVFFHL